MPAFYTDLYTVFMVLFLGHNAINHSFNVDINNNFVCLGNNNKKKIDEIAFFYYKWLALLLLSSLSLFVIVISVVIKVDFYEWESVRRK